MCLKKRQLFQENLSLGHISGLWNRLEGLKERKMISKAQLDKIDTIFQLTFNLSKLSAYYKRLKSLKKWKSDTLVTSKE